jgi:hypothetical protein
MSDEAKAIAGQPNPLRLPTLGLEMVTAADLEPGDEIVVRVGRVAKVATGKVFLIDVECGPYEKGDHVRRVVR